MRRVRREFAAKLRRYFSFFRRFAFSKRRKKIAAPLKIGLVGVCRAAFGGFCAKPQHFGRCARIVLTNIEYLPELPPEIFGRGRRSRRNLRNRRNRRSRLNSLPQAAAEVSPKKL
ncbi:MAG: hypothetical protein DBX55_10635 [Verrucomicrobia bacterium]|nr:MAG: hypothetical protein DBX55_10635 [Verrucomicrobiota bacterium]